MQQLQVMLMQLMMIIFLFTLPGSLRYMECADVDMGLCVSQFSGAPLDDPIPPSSPASPSFSPSHAWKGEAGDAALCVKSSSVPCDMLQVPSCSSTTVSSAASTCRRSGCVLQASPILLLLNLFLLNLFLLPDVSACSFFFPLTTSSLQAALVLR